MLHSNAVFYYVLKVAISQVGEQNILYQI